MLKTLNNDYKKFSCLRGSIITLEGIIAAGKSTLGNFMAQYLNSIGLNARYFPEYVNSDFLTLYIKNMKKFSFSFQVLMLMKRIEIYNEAERFTKMGGISIIDRSINGDYTFAQMQYNKGFFDNEEWIAYNALIKKEALFEPHLTIYLHCTPETSMRRLLIRNNKNEITGYTIDYMTELKKEYEKSITNIKHQILTLDWDSDIIIDNKIIVDTLIKIKNILY